MQRGPQPALVQLRAAQLPDFGDDADLASLRQAIARTQPAWRKRGDDAAAASASRLLGALAAGGDAAARRRAIAGAFRVLQVRDPILMTAYYEPELAARVRPDARFRYPLYARPPDLTPSSAPVRAAIDAGALAGRGLELAWTDDPLGLFLLHVQGSGRLRFPDGTVRPALFAGTNEKPYKALARVLIEHGHLTRAEATVPGIRRVMATLPADEQRALMQENPRYVFFKLGAAPGDPVGSMGVPLTAGRSIATDPTLVPSGRIAYLVTPSARRFVVAQDVGAAIKGAHVDLFVGPGEDAEAFAGSARDRGTLYLLEPVAQ
ncbi:MAG: MltA domain-containing protein [bacterium]|nr:MltA domain-containing protein [bacterium]